MSIAVPLEELADAVTDRGPMAYLVTVGEGGRPRVVSVSVELGSEVDQGSGAAPTLEVGAGRHTAANIAERPDVTLLWPVDPDHPKHSLLVDGIAEVLADGERLAISPSGAILHRVRAGRGA